MGKPIRLVYIAGPFRGANAWEVEQNIRRAEALCLEVWAAGFVGVCPHSMLRFFDGALADDVWLKGDIELLVRCDAVLLARGWRRSKGAEIEMGLAKDAGMPMFESVRDLEAYAATEVASDG